MKAPRTVGRPAITLLLLIGAWRVVSASDVASKNIRFDVSPSIATKSLLRKKRFGFREVHSLSSFDSGTVGLSLQSKTSALSSIFRYRAGSEPIPSLISKTLFALNQTINVITAAIAGSGLLGSWIASLIICKMQNMALSSSLNSSADTGESGSSPVSLINRKWSLTMLSSGMYLIVRAICTGTAINSFSPVSDIGFLLTLWLFSSFVDPVDGGLIGCSYVSLELISSVMVNTPSQLMKFRLTPLDDEASSEHIEKTIQSEPNDLPMGEILSQALSSVPMLASQPQYFLSMYLLSSTILHWMTVNDYEGMDLVSWFKAELPPWRTGVRVRALSFRLFTLHVLVMAIKGVAACALL